MRPSKFSDEQIVQALRTVAAGTSAAQLCRTLGITETTFYRWRRRHDINGPPEQREVRVLRDENYRLKELVANLMLEAQNASPARRKR